MEEQWGYSMGLSDVWASSPFKKIVTLRKEHVSMEVDRFLQTTDNMRTTCWPSHDLQLGRGSYSRYGREGEGSEKSSFASGSDQSAVLGNPVEATKTGIRRAISTASKINFKDSVIVRTLDKCRPSLVIRWKRFPLRPHLSCGATEEASLLEVNVLFCYCVGAIVTYTTKGAMCFLYPGAQGLQYMQNTKSIKVINGKIKEGRSRMSSPPRDTFIKFRTW